MGLLDTIKPYLTAIKLVGVGLLLAVIAYQRIENGNLRDWRDQVIVATTHAVDSHPADGKAKPPVKADAVVGWISTLGNFRRDAIATRATATASDLTNKIRAEGEGRTVNKEQVDVLQNDLAASERRYSALLARAGRMHDERSAATGNPGGRGATDLSGLSGDRPGVAEAAGADAIPAGPAGDVPALTIEERYDAERQAIQLDALITTVERIQAIDLQGGSER